MKLDKIYEPIQDQLKKVDAELKTRLNSDNKLVHRINKYILDVPGKRLRPALVLFSARMGNYQGKRAIPIAAALEIIHTATLIHDDVVDNSVLRRGQPTINSKWGNNISIILGDHWYSKAFSILSQLKMPKVLDMILEDINLICIGELEQLKRCYDFSITEQDYFDIVKKKTAALMSFCCRIGAFSSGMSKSEIRSLADYGLNLGIVFQIVDDCLDFVGTEEKIGKSLRSDICGGKPTLPLIYALTLANKKDRAWIKKSLKSRQIDNTKAKRIAGIVQRSAGIEHSLRKAEEYKNISKRNLESFKRSKYRDALSALTDYVVQRAY